MGLHLGFRMEFEPASDLNFQKKSSKWHSLPIIQLCMDYNSRKIVFLPIFIYSVLEFWVTFVLVQHVPDQTCYGILTVSSAHVARNYWWTLSIFTLMADSFVGDITPKHSSHDVQLVTRWESLFFSDTTYLSYSLSTCQNMSKVIIYANF